MSVRSPWYTAARRAAPAETAVVVVPLLRHDRLAGAVFGLAGPGGLRGRDGTAGRLVAVGPVPKGGLPGLAFEELEVARLLAHATRAGIPVVGWRMPEHWPRIVERWLDVQAKLLVCADVHQAALLVDKAGLRPPKAETLGLEDLSRAAGFPLVPERRTPPAEWTAAALVWFRLLRPALLRMDPAVLDDGDDDAPEEPGPAVPQRSVGDLLALMSAGGRRRTPARR